MRMKKRFFACAILVLLMSLMSQATFAYFTTTATAENVITSGGIDVDLVETSNGAAWKDVSGIMPGDTISKVVNVKNNQQPAWVRVWVEFVLTDEDGSSTTYTLDEFMVRSESGSMPIHVEGFNFDYWEYNALDGHMYYLYPLATGATTAKPLFTDVSFGTEMGNEFQNCELSINITAEGVQVANNAEDGEIYDVLGWPNCEEDHFIPQE